MFENYTVAVKVKLFNEVSAGLIGMSRQFEGLTDKALVFQANLKKIKNQVNAGFGMIAGGGALASPFVYAITKAAELQKQMIGIQVATGGTVDQMERMRAVMERSSAGTMFSTLDVAKMAKIIATANSFNAAQVTSVLPEYAKFADVQLLLKGTGYQTSVADAVKLAHTAKIYDPAGLAKYLDTLTKASLLSSGDITQLGHALKYSQGMGQSILGIDPNNMVILAAFMNRLGLSGSRGGTNLIAALGRTIPGVFGSGLLKGKSAEALAAMGMVDNHGYSKFFKNGRFDMFSFIEGLAHYTSTQFSKDPLHAREIVYRNLQHAFGTQGSRVASLLTTPAALQMLQQMERQFSQLAGTGAIQDTYVKQSVSQQYQTALTNFQNAFIELGYNLLPLATKALNAVNRELDIFIPWMRQHKTEVKYLAEAFIGLSAAMAFGGTVTLLTAAFTGLRAILSGIMTITGMKALAGWYMRAGAGAAAAGEVAGGAAIAAGAGVAGAAGLFGYGAYKLYGVLKQIWQETAPGGAIDQQTAAERQHDKDNGGNIIIQVDGNQLMQTLLPHLNRSTYLGQIQQSNNFMASMTPIQPNTGVPFR